MEYEIYFKRFITGLLIGMLTSFIFIFGGMMSDKDCKAKIEGLDIADRYDINKLIDSEFMSGVYIGAHCVSLTEEKQKVDKTCLDALTRIKNMK